MILESLAMAGQVALGLVFLLSALFKVRYPASVTQAVRSYGIAPAVLASIAAGALTVTEATVAMSLISGFGDELARLVAFGLLLGFLAGVSWSLRQGRDHACGCFSPDERISGRSVIRLVLLLCLTALSLGIPAGGLVEAFRAGGESDGLPYSVAIVGLALTALLAGHLLLETSRLFASPPLGSPLRTRR